MKRRNFIQGLLAAPAAAIPTLGPQRDGGAAEPGPEISYTEADVAADAVLGFFDADQFAALRKLGSIFMPATRGNPGADDTDAAAFLDFLLDVSGQERQRLYREGLDRLNYQARSRFGRPFAELDEPEAAELLIPLGRPWSYRPADPFERFLRTVREDLRTATLNSRQWAEATGDTRNTRYLLPL